MEIVPERAADELRTVLENGKSYQKFGMKDNEQTESVFASSDAKPVHTKQNLELWQKEMIDEIQNLQTTLGRMSQKNEKLVKMHEKAILERNELLKFWQKAADALKHAEKIDLLKGDRCHNIARRI